MNNAVSKQTNEFHHWGTFYYEFFKLRIEGEIKVTFFVALKFK